MMHGSPSDHPLSIVVVGASGDLARRKIYPSLFALYCQGYLPEEFHVFGLARSEMSLSEFRERIELKLTCRYAPGESCAEKMAAFLGRCYYSSGQYDEINTYLDLYVKMHRLEGEKEINRLFYLAIPPSIFTPTCRALGSSGMVRCGSKNPWSRVVVEKPFGRDRESSDALVRDLGRVFTEPNIYRIDHYLGKEMVQNLMVLRFANTVFEPLFNREHVQSVQVTWTEPLGVEGRGGYFEHYGIIRDVMQNHLLQVMALVAMDRPASMGASDVCAAKTALLNAVPPLEPDDVLTGQYQGASRDGREWPAYRDDPTVADDSLAATYAAVRLRVENERWSGVPFLLRAGKGADRQLAEIRIRFRPVATTMFAGLEPGPIANELVIRVQPDEAIYLLTTNKVPGLTLAVEPTRLDLTYSAAFDQEIPDAYESLILDVIRGNRTLFIRKEELAAAWDIFTPVLHHLDENQAVPEPYPFGTLGPAGAKPFAEKFGVEWQP